jgi:hypothetical protein
VEFGADKDNLAEIVGKVGVNLKILSSPFKTLDIRSIG